MKNETLNTTGATRKGRSNYSHKKLDAKKARKRAEAMDRQVEHDELTVAEKIEKALTRRGKSAREVARLNKLLGTTPPPAPVKDKKSLTKKKKVVK